MKKPKDTGVSVYLLSVYQFRSIRFLSRQKIKNKIHFLKIQLNEWFILNIKLIIKLIKLNNKKIKLIKLI